MIKNKLKIGFLVAVLSLCIGVGSAKAANTYSANTTIDLSSPDIDFTILSGSSDDGLVVNAGTIVATVSSGETFTVTSASRDFTVTPATTTSDTFSVNQTCSAGTAQVVITGGNSTAFTFTPASDQCTTASSGSGSSGGGGGGGGGATTTVATTTTTPATATVSTTTTTTVAGTTTTTTTTYDLGTITLKNGSNGQSVVQLQKLLNKILMLGLKEDGKLGPKTIAVIKKWQKSHNLKADGLIGPKTKAMMKAEAEK